MEYESRRDADDAYHEMHNKRIGRDDLLKIEVSQETIGLDNLTCSDIVRSGLVRHHRPAGASTQAEVAVKVAVKVAVTVAVTVVVARGLLVADALLPHHAAVIGKTEGMTNIEAGALVARTEMIVDVVGPLTSVTVAM